MLTLVFVVPCPSMEGSFVQIEESPNNLMLLQAKDNLLSAYISVLNSDRIGGDVSELVYYLNNAINFYYLSEKAFNLGDNVAAINYAKKVILITDEIIEDNVYLATIAKHKKMVEFNTKIILSIIYVILIIVSGFFLWRLFKFYYIKRMMTLRPEVVLDES
jgi:hypothetical protein